MRFVCRLFSHKSCMQTHVVYVDRQGGYLSRSELLKFKLLTDNFKAAICVLCFVEDPGFVLKWYYICNIIYWDSNHCINSKQKQSTCVIIIKKITTCLCHQPRQTYFVIIIYNNAVLVISIKYHDSWMMFYYVLLPLWFTTRLELLVRKSGAN